MKKNITEKIIFAGYGGQGILFMGKVLANAAMLDGKSVTWIPSYGAEVRGGTAYSMVVISDDKIASPIVTAMTSCVVMNQLSFNKYLNRIQPGGLLVVNASLVTGLSKAKHIVIAKVKATDIASKLGNLKVANMVMLGGYLAMTKIVAVRSVEASLENMISQSNPDLLKLNITAFKKGVSALK